MSGFAQALPVVLGAEGGFSDDPHDRGGATNYGITEATYNAWRGDKGLPFRPVKEIDRDEVEAIYHERYWLAGKCDALPWPLSLAHFDACVNHGPGNAWRILQRALGVGADGIPGPRTMGALEGSDTVKLWRDWMVERTAFYLAIVERDRSQIRFLRGWLSHRIVGLHREMQRLS